MIVSKAVDDVENYVVWIKLDEFYMPFKHMQQFNLWLQVIDGGDVKSELKRRW